MRETTVDASMALAAPAQVLGRAAGKRRLNKKKCVEWCCMVRRFTPAKRFDLKGRLPKALRRCAAFCGDMQ